MMFPVAYSSKEQKIDAAFFAECAASGAAAIEIAARDYGGMDFPAVARMAEQAGVRLWSLHLPYAPFAERDISCLDEAQRLRAVAGHWELMAQAAAIGIDKFVVHPSGEPIPDAERARRLQTAQRSLVELAEAASTLHAQIAVENLPRDCLGNVIAEMRELLGADERLRMNFDLNHLMRGESQVEYIRALGDKIISLHVSDTDGVNERHWLPGEGKIDWDAVLAALRAAGYNGMWLYEVPFTLSRTILRPRVLRPADFVRNARELFAHISPTLISRPKPNLGMWE